MKLQFSSILIFLLSRLLFQLVGIWVIKAGLFQFSQQFPFTHSWVLNLRRLVPVLMTIGSNLGKCRRLTSTSWRTELEFAPQFFWIQSSSTDACHSPKTVRTASPVMLIDLFRATVRTATFLHLNICSKLREKIFRSKHARNNSE